VHQAFEVKKVESEDEETDRNKWSGVNENEERRRMPRDLRIDRRLFIFLPRHGQSPRKTVDGLLIQGLTGGLFGCLDDAFQDRPVRGGDGAAQPLQRCAGSPRESAQAAGRGGLVFRPGPAPKPRA